MRRNNLFALVALAVAAIASVGRSIFGTAAAFFAPVWKQTAKHVAELANVGGDLGFSSSALAYDGPTVDLRHEANTSRRAAARGI